MLRRLYVATDVITIERTGENFRLIYDVKGRFAVHRITPEEAKVSRYVAMCIMLEFLGSQFLKVPEFNSGIFREM